jgi:hypothetical protein
VKNELLFSLNHHRYRKKIVPVLYKKCRYEKLSWTLSNFQVVDFTGSLGAGYRELIVKILSHLGLSTRAARAGASS